ncbi:MAG: Uncharacterized protein FD161_2179 [Limisphaerales bacterium]|nr:MAG: Uncharacterized protein FD161_2179 [Limisphaerales bacterium]KAG0508885.1 MAG: Uncharacterized protein E1N63_1981 [Limisphaerales bacterium]TXT50226.1 MAG: Uncharacterized protein FD140_2494 [Limisphaerales bacterium]
MKRWAIYIDIEGFSLIYSASEVKAIRLLGELIQAIYQVGSRAFGDDLNRLFVHQTGDGFIIVSGSKFQNTATPLSIAIVLMRSFLMSGGAAKCGVAEGDFADIKGCYPEPIRSRMASGGVVPLGSGFMRVFPVMGSAMVRAHQLTNRASGALLLIPPKMGESLPTSFKVSKCGEDYSVIDWIHSDAPEIAEIALKSGIDLAVASNLRSQLVNYLLLNQDGPSAKWRQNTLQFNGCG